MKLTKISLAALVALGAFSSVASATPLEEAIKDVDISGMARYRYTNDYARVDRAAGPKETNAKHNFKFVTNFKAAIDDNFFGVLGLRYNSNDGSGNNKVVGVRDVSKTDSKFSVYQLYLGYKVGNTTITAGKQMAGSFFVDDEVVTGIKVVNTDIEGLTLAAYAFDALEASDESDGNLLNNRNLANFDTGNQYGAAVIGSFDPIGFQLWYNTLRNVTDLVAAEVTGNFSITDDFGLGFKAQFVNSDADSGFKKIETAYNDGMFYATELNLDLFGARLGGGYIGWKVDDNGITSFSLEDQGKLIDPVKQGKNGYVGGSKGPVFDYTFMQGKGNFFFAKAGYSVDKFDFDVAYIYGKRKEVSGEPKLEYQEVVPQITYNYSKKLQFSTFYSWAKAKDGIDKLNETYQRYRFEAKYSF